MNGRMFAPDENGRMIPVNGSITLGGLMVPIVDGEFDWPMTPEQEAWERKVTQAEWDLIKRYDRGDFDEAADVG